MRQKRAHRQVRPLQVQANTIDQLRKVNKFWAFLASDVPSAPIKAKYAIAATERTPNEEDKKDKFGDSATPPLHQS
jgi:hypothetical protein